MLSWMGVESCKDSCGGADPAKDTVKFNSADINAVHHQQERQRKEMEEKQEQLRLELERQKKEQERQERDRREREARMRREEEEIARQEAEEAERLRREELDRQHEEEIQRKKAEELQRQREEQARKEAEERTRKEMEAAKAQLSEWLAKNKYASVNAKKKTLMKSRYPLHDAVAQKDVTAIRLLLRFGADPTLKNSAGRTAQQLADSMKGGETASAAFTSQTRPRAGGA